MTTIDFTEYRQKKRQDKNDEFNKLEEQRQKLCKELETIDRAAANKHLLGQTGDDPIFARYAANEANKMIALTEMIQEIRQKQKNI